MITAVQGGCVSGTVTAGMHEHGIVASLCPEQYGVISVVLGSRLFLRSSRLSWMTRPLLSLLTLKAETELSTQELLQICHSSS